jgi:hypothetical protein
LKVTRSTSFRTVDVVADGTGLSSRAGTVLLALAAQRLGLTDGLSGALAETRERRSAHDPGRVLCDLAVMAADGGSCVSDFAVLALRVLELALEQLPESALDGEILARSDSAGASHDFAGACRETRIRFSLGYPINSSVREQILTLDESAWMPAVNQDGEQREGAWVTELTSLLDLSS